MIKLEPAPEEISTASRLRTRDDRLREHGFRIHARSASGAAIWERNGRLFFESEAHARVTQELKKLETG